MKPASVQTRFGGFMKKLLAGVSLVAATVGLVPLAAPTASAKTPASTAVSIPTPPAIRWAACSDTYLKSFHAQCGTLTVPLDYANPRGTKITLAVSRIKHTVTAKKYQGVMLTNPGGPGGSGLWLATLGQMVPQGAGNAYDWIGFDPRGVGSSKPAVTCDPNVTGFARPDFVPSTPAKLAVWQARAKAYAQACARKNGPILKNLTTIDSAKDMESLRLALGQKQINYYGFSYGTYLGQVYSTLYPTHVRRMVLDSNVDPRGVWYQLNLDQDVAFEKNINIWFGWLAKYDSTYHLRNTAAKVKSLFNKTQAKLMAKPAAGKIGGDEWVDIFLNAAYYQFTWPELGTLFAQFNATGNAQPLIEAYGGPRNDNGNAVYSAVECTDVQWPTAWSKWSADNWRTYRVAPYMTWDNAWMNAPCIYWPTKPRTPVKINGAKVASALLIDETLDGATPYAGSVQVRKLYPKARLLALPGGTSHANSLAGNACEDNSIATYLATGKLPTRKVGNGPDATCAPLPQPTPGDATNPYNRSRGVTPVTTPGRPGTLPAVLAALG